MLKEMKDPSLPELWKMAAFLELCPNDIRDQVFLRIDEIKENYAELREKALGMGGEQGGTGGSRRGRRPWISA